MLKDRCKITGKHIFIHSTYCKKTRIIKIKKINIHRIQGYRVGEQKKFL